MGYDLVKSKFLCALAAICMCVSMFPALATAEVPLDEDLGENISYSFDASSATLTITGSGPMKNCHGNHSPFYHNTDIQHIVISDGVTSVGSSVFMRCSSLESIDLPQSVTSIDAYALCECMSIKTIDIPDNVTFIGAHAFEGCSQLTSVVIPKSVNTIEKDALKTDSHIICAVLNREVLLESSGLDTDDTLAGYSNSSTDVYACNNGISFVPIMGTLVKEVPATCTDAGVKDYYFSTADDLTLYFEDEACNNRIVDIDIWKTDRGAISALGHELVPTWESDDTSHWRECTRCESKIDYSPHSYGDWQVTTDPTDTTSGLRKHVCTECGYVETEVIPPLGTNQDETAKPDTDSNSETKPDDNMSHKENKPLQHTNVLDKSCESNTSNKTVSLNGELPQTADQSIVLVIALIGALILSATFSSCALYRCHNH